MGINQIATVFNPEYEQYINLEGYDRIARYFEIPKDSDDEMNAKYGISASSSNVSGPVLPIDYLYSLYCNFALK